MEVFWLMSKEDTPISAEIAWELSTEEHQCDTCTQALLWPYAAS
jgi:hypothetical protein